MTIIIKGVPERGASPSPENLPLSKKERGTARG
jgi:hypothetical protein